MGYEFSGKSFSSSGGPTNVLSMMEPRISSARVAELLGVSTRHVTNLAASGVIPGAKKVGKVWRFDPVLFVEWMEECQSPRPTSTSNPEAGITISASRSTECNIEKRFERLIAAPRKNGRSSGSKNSANSRRRANLTGGS